jgi:hypothetical protein
LSIRLTPSFPPIVYHRQNTLYHSLYSICKEENVVFIAGGEIPVNNGRNYDNVMASFEGEGKHRV